jgi:hypothetical protein
MDGAFYQVFGPKYEVESRTENGIGPCLERTSSHHLKKNQKQPYCLDTIAVISPVNSGEPTSCLMALRHFRDVDYNALLSSQ